MEVLVALARRYAFGDIAGLVSDGQVVPRDAELVTHLCAFGQRLLDLDAEDFGQPGPDEDDHGSRSVPADLVNRARASRMPQTPREQPRGALASLRPAYRLLLEVIAARWRRREMAPLVAAVHIASEYAPLLVWQTVLGHAADPARMGASVGGPGSRFGQAEDRVCAHTRTDRSAAGRALRVSAEPPEGWRAYLDRQHSNVAHALGVCAAECANPCAVVNRVGDGADLRRRCTVALAFCDSAIVRLRHAAPVGHGFGVPSPPEVLEAWGRTRQALARRDAAVQVDDGFPLPGLTSLITDLAGVPMAPDTLIADVAAHLAATLRSTDDRQPAHPA